MNSGVMGLEAEREQGLGGYASAILWYSHTLSHIICKKSSEYRTVSRLTSRKLIFNTVFHINTNVRGILKKEKENSLRAPKSQ